MSAGGLLAIVIALGLVFKVFYLCSYSTSNPYFSIAGMDSAIYVGWAKSINAEGWLGKEIFYQAPLYPYLLSVLFRVFGDGFLSVYIVQLLMGACILWLIYLIGRRIYGERAGLIATLLCVAYAPFTAFETKLLTNVTEILLGLLYLHLLTRAEDEGRLGYWLGGAAALGFAIICRPSYIAVVPLMIMFLLLGRRKEIKKTIPSILAVGLVPCLIVGAVAVRNYVVGKDFVPISSNGGITFAQGNNPMAGGSVALLPGFSGSPLSQKLEMTQIAERESGRSLKPSEVSAFWFQWAFRFIKEHPLDYLRLLGAKALLVFSNRELGSNFLMSIEENLTPSLKAACVPFGFIMAWAVPGLILLLRSRRPASALVSTFFGILLMLLVFLVDTRYRMTLAPSAAIMAGGGADYLLGNIRNLGRASLILAVVAVFLALSLPPFSPMDRAQLLRGDADYWANLAITYQKTAQPEKALRAFDNAIAMNPGMYRGHLMKARLLRSLHPDGSDALRWAEQVVVKFPRQCSAHSMLADIYRAMGRSDEAIRSYQRATLLNPKEPEAYLRLAALLSEQKEQGKAKAVLAEGLRARPDDIRLQYEYAVVCTALGDREEALAWLNKVTSKDPGYPGSLQLLRLLGTH